MATRDPDLLSIGQVATSTETPITTLRYYERIGLIPAPQRSGGQRRYTPSVLMRLMVIQYCRTAGLSLDEIALVLDDDSPGRTATKALAAERIRAIDQQIDELQFARRMVDAALVCTCPTVTVCECGAMLEIVELIAAKRGTVPELTRP